MLTKPTSFSSHTPVRSSFMDTTPPSHSFFSSNSIPKLKNITPNLDLSHIPPLTVGQSSNKRLDLSDMGNPVQKKVKYNPEIILYPNLSSQVLEERLANYGVEQLINQKYMGQLTRQRGNHEKQVAENKSSFEFSVPTIKKRETDTREIGKPKLLNCFEIPQNKKPVEIKKVINYSLQTSEQLQQALEILKQKIVNTAQSNVNTLQQLAKPQRPELVVKTSKTAWDGDVCNYDQVNLVKNSEECYSGSPISTTEDSANSCSTSDLCESEKMSPLWSNFADLESVNVKQPQLENQINFLTFNAADHGALVMMPDNLSNWGNSPKYVFATSHTEIRKIKNISNDAESDISETPIGHNYQAEIPPLCSHPGLFRSRRCLKLKWNPSSIQEDKLNEYFNSLQEMLKYTINPEKAIKLLKECDNEPWRVYKRIQGKEKEFAREFLIRPKRRP